jgi:hypothetical protein
MRRDYLLIVTALGEGGTGLALLALPAGVLTLLLGVEQALPELATLARVAGAALLALGIACRPGRPDQRGPSRKGLLIAVLTYDVAAAVILAYAGWFLGLVGLALWPAVVLHAALAAWCVVCLCVEPHGEGAGTPG